MHFIVYLFVVNAYLPDVTDAVRLQRKHAINNRRNMESCQTCFEDTCVSVDEPRCSYYTEANTILHGDDEEAMFGDPSDNAEIRAEVDALVGEAMSKAANDERFQECIPFVSKYTNCNKDNICLGCNTCTCNLEGKWKCNQTQKCRSETKPFNIVDHRILVLVLDNIKKTGVTELGNRRKRSESPGNITKITPEQLAKWMYGVHSLRFNVTENITSENDASLSTTTDIFNEATTITTDTTKSTTVIDEPDIFSFDELLNYSKDKKDGATSGMDDQDSEKQSKSKKLEAPSNIVTEDLMRSLSDLKIDDIMSVDTDEEKIGSKAGTIVNLIRDNDNRHEEISFTMIKDILNIDNNLEDTHDWNPKNLSIVKRDATVSTEKNNKTTNNSDSVEEFKEHVLYPMTNIIEEKQREVNELVKIKANLINLVKTCKKQDVLLDERSDKINHTETSLNIYKLHVIPNLDFNTKRRDGENNMEMEKKYLIKLKRDIYEVLRDIAVIQKRTKLQNIPKDLNFLIRALKYYVYKHIKGGKNQTINSWLSDINLRRYNEFDKGFIEPNYLKSYFIQILDNLDKNLPNSKGLGYLSIGSKKVIGRIIQQMYVDEFPVVSVRAQDPDYNMTNDLQEIGENWKKLTTSVIKSDIFERLYSMKSLHLSLSLAIERMNDALTLIDYAHSRRTGSRIGNNGEQEVVTRIDQELSTMLVKLRKLFSFIEIKGASKEIELETEPPNKLKKRQSFLKHLKSIFKKSKADLLKKIQKKFHKSKVPKYLTVQDLDDVSLQKMFIYENVIKKYQQDMELDQRRKKRSIRHLRIKDRIKNILPKYLRGKMGPLLDGRKKNKKNQNYNINNAMSKTNLHETKMH